MQEVGHLDAVIDRDLETDHCFVEVLCDSEVHVLEACVYHEEVQVGLLHVVLAVEVLKNLKKLFEAEPDLAFLLVAQCNTPHDYPADLDVGLLESEIAIASHILVLLKLH